jgi:PAS domain-containing protein
MSRKPTDEELEKKLKKLEKKTLAGKKAEDALRVSEAEKKAILDASVDRIRLVDTDMKILWANKTTTRELNVAPEELLGQPCYKVFFDNVSCPNIFSQLNPSVNSW